MKIRPNHENSSLLILITDYGVFSYFIMNIYSDRQNFKLTLTRNQLLDFV